ncbi:anti-sigma factor domain-containing protein [Clostridium chrysemydis]|uniref:anti-sigma factor domain-containing protein n=1 Tax=Clostridium chrysemydis TaxID=2665504 RepID=UPI001884107A
MEKFEKNKYSFSEDLPALFAVGETIDDARRKQINDIINELYDYKVLLKDLVVLEPSIKQRNIILNLALYITSNLEILEKFQKDKELPIKELRRTTFISKSFVERWNDYLIAYIVIFANPYYKLVQDYLRIMENGEIIEIEEVEEIEEANEVDSKVVSLEVEKKEETENEESKEEEADETLDKDTSSNFDNVISITRGIENKGMVLSVTKRSMYLLTSVGEFKKVKRDRDSGVGKEGFGTKKKSLKDFKIPIAIFIILIIAGVSVFYHQYKKIDSTILIKTTSQVKLDVNPFGRVIYIYSSTDRGKEMLNEVGGLNENFDEVLRNVLKYSKDNGMVPEGRIFVSITGDPIKYGMLEKTGRYIIDNKIELVINNAGTEHKLNEIMQKENS